MAITDIQNWQNTFRNTTPVNRGIWGSAMNRNMFTPQALNAFNTMRNVGGTALRYSGLANPVGAAATAAYVTPKLINTLTARDPNATRSSLFNIDLTKNANEGAALPGSTLNDWGSEMGPIPDDGVVPPIKNINRPLPSPYQDRIMNENLMRDRGNIDNRFSFNPLNWGVMGLARKMIEPNTPEENFGLGYFNRDPQTGRTYGNQAYDVFAGKNVASAFGEGMGGAAQKRIDRINKTLGKWESDEEKYAKQLANTTLYRRRDEFKKQLAQYNKDLAAGTGGADTPKGPVITSQGDQVNTGGGQRDTSGWSSPGYSTRGGFTGTGGSPGTGQRGHHGNFSQGGRIGYANGEFVDEDINIEGPGYDINENVMMASDENNTRLLENLFEKYLDLGFSPEDAEKMAMDEFEQMSMGPEQDQGIASLV